MNKSNNNCEGSSSLQSKKNLQPRKLTKNPELKICDMMMIVYEWRRFYTSVKNQNSGKKHNLMQACDKVNIWAKTEYGIEVPKKTLDHHFKLVM